MDNQPKATEYETNIEFEIFNIKEDNENFRNSLKKIIVN